MRSTMTTTPRSIGMLLVLLTVSLPSAAQLHTIKPDTTSLGKARQRVLQAYVSGVGEQLAVFTGRLEREYPGNYLEPPYFKTGGMMPGTVWYDGLEYPGLLLRYDKVRDHVVILSPDSSRKIVLLSERVNQFYLQDHLFVRLVHDSTPGCPATGFYALLCDGDAQLIMGVNHARFNENVGSRNTTSHAVSYTLVDARKFYVWRNGRYYQLRSPRDLAKIFIDREKELKAYIQSRHIRFSSDNYEEQFTACIDYLNTLTR